MPRPKITGPHTLDQWAREAPLQHRGLLLFAMQGEHNPTGLLGRSLNAVAKALGRSQPTVTGWSRDRHWAERIQNHGEDAAKYAIAMYRALYLKDHGVKELPSIQHLMKLQIGPMDATSTEVHEEAMRLLNRVIPPPEATAEAQEAQERVESALEKSKADRIKQNRKIRRVATKALDALETALKGKKARVSVSDLPALMKVINQLDQEHTRMTVGEGVPDSSIAVEDSIRVKLAKASGGSLMQAHYDDLMEAKLLLEAMMQLPPEETGLGVGGVEAVG